MWNPVADAEALIDLQPTNDAEVRAQATIITSVMRQLGLAGHQPPAAKPKADPAASTLTLRGAAQQLGVSPKTIQRLIKAGKLTTLEVNGRPRIRRVDLERFVAGAPAVEGPDPGEVAARLFERHHRRSR